MRLDSIILNKLHREAEQKDISANTLVSHIIRRHIDWHSNAAKAGFVTVRRGLISNLINRLLCFLIIVLHSEDQIGVSYA